MPKEVNAKCQECGTVQGVVWFVYGSETSCVECEAAPAYLIRQA